MDYLNQWLNSDLTLGGLFLSSLLGATLLPGGSEFVLLGVLKLHPELYWSALSIASLGNTLGGLISFVMGWFSPHTKTFKQLEKVQRYGVASLLFAWLPLVGDALCLAAGWLRLNPWQALFLMFIGKFARYAVLATSAL